MMNKNLSNGVAVNKMKSTAGEEIPFVDVCYSLYLFTVRLYKNLIENEVKDVFFFAREGQPLKKMFDFYQSMLDGGSLVKTHYLKVSRRSTFLLSLGPLAEEDFSVLFRQYRKISISDFLKSLDLVEYAAPIAAELGIGVEDFSVVSEDLPKDQLFQKMLQLEIFREIYEDQRVERSSAFGSYLKGLLGSITLPEALHVVDVGWKGSIQDNIYHWMRRGKSENAKVQGYYLGLIAQGAHAENNIKDGLLFSSIGGRTPGFQVFNENRSLYEIILHADHGSARGYIFSDLGEVIVVEDDFIEGAMIFENVQPVSISVMEKFKSVASEACKSKISDAELLRIAIDQHGRMVFNPSNKEIDWIFSVSHVENFGVFEESRFSRSEVPFSIVKKLRFTWNLVLMRRPSQLGFWPWLTIQRNALPGIGSLYGLFRRWQSRSKNIA